MKFLKYIKRVVFGESLTAKKEVYIPLKVIPDGFWLYNKYTDGTTDMKFIKDSKYYGTG